MRSPAIALCVVLLLAGCGQKPPAQGPHLLNDPVDESLKPPYDLLSADLQELNGSLMLRLTFRNFTSPGEGLRFPHFVATLAVVADGRNTSYFARNDPAPEKPAPSLRWVLGLTQDGRILAETCAITSVNGEPWRIDLDLPHNQTGLLAGGAVTSLHVETGDFENHSMDEAEAGFQFPVRGGPSPYANGTCPLVAERPS